MRSCCSSLLRKLTSAVMGPCVRRDDIDFAMAPRANWMTPMTTKLFDLSGKVALVTGGNGGIGLGMAKGLAEAGATGAIAGRGGKKDAAASKELGGREISIKVDLRDESACRAAVDQAAQKLGRLDILVNNAGTNIR